MRCTPGRTCCGTAARRLPAVTFLGSIGPPTSTPTAPPAASPGQPPVHRGDVVRTLPQGRGQRPSVTRLQAAAHPIRTPRRSSPRPTQTGPRPDLLPPPALVLERVLTPPAGTSPPVFGPLPRSPNSLALPLDRPRVMVTDFTPDASQQAG